MGIKGGPIESVDDSYIPDKKKVCARCGNVFYAGRYGHAAKYCLDCRDMVRIERQRLWDRNKQKQRRT